MKMNYKILFRVECQLSRKEKSLNELISLISVLGGLFTWNKTEDLAAGIIVAFGVLGVYALIVYLIYFKKQTDLKSAGMEQIDEMTGFEFEKYLLYLFKKAGYKANKTRYVGDYGADLVLTNLQNRKKIVVQAKRFKRNVGIKAVQEVVGSIKHYNADEGWVVTNSNFTKPAIELAKSNKVRLINRRELVKLINKVSKSNSHVA